MDYHARVAMYANTLGLSLAEVEVERIAGRKSSTLYSILNLPGGGPECSRLLDELRLQIKRKYEAEDACTLHMLCHLTLNELSDICIQWAKSEKKCEPLLILSEQRMT